MTTHAVSTAGGTQHRSASEVLDACRLLFEPSLRAAVDSLPGTTRRIAGYHLGWWEQDGSPSGAGTGKAIRPALALLSSAAVGGRERAAVPAAVAVELVHDFTLLHDDVMDHDRTRRHRPTAWAAFGVGPAILTGDALLTLAMDVLAGSGHPASLRAVRMLGGAVQEIVDGQMSDLDFERRTDVTPTECLRMAESKTGALMGVACALGALFGGGTVGQVVGLERFGRDLGLAYQLVDDLLGIWGDPATTGKPVWGDLRCGKKSLPVVAALRAGNPAGRELDALYHQGRELTDIELAASAELIELAGGRDWCHARADELTSAALRRLPAATREAGPRTNLRLITHLITHRDS